MMKHIYKKSLYALGGVVFLSYLLYVVNICSEYEICVLRKAADHFALQSAFYVISDLNHA